MNYLDFILKGLGRFVLKCYYFESLIEIPKGVYIINPNENQPPGFLYIGSEDDVARECRKGLLPIESVFFVANYNNKPHSINLLNNYHNIVFTTLSIAELNNMLNVIMAEYNSIEDKDGQLLFSKFLHNIAYNKDVSGSYLRAFTKSLDKKIEEYFSFIIIRFNKSETLFLYKNAITKYIKKIFHAHNFTITGGKIVILFSQSTVYYKVPNDIESALLDFAKKYDCKIGIGTSLRDYNYARTNYYIVDRMLSIVTKLSHIDDNTYLFYEEKYAIYTAIDLCKSSFKKQFDHSTIMYLAHPVVARLEDYDKENDSELSKFLRTYLLCNGNLTQTANTLFIHRNTAINRLNTVSSFIGEDLNDADIRFRLLFSYKMLDYDESFIDPDY